MSIIENSVGLIDLKLIELELIDLKLINLKMSHLKYNTAIMAHLQFYLQNCARMDISSSLSFKLTIV